MQEPGKVLQHPLACAKTVHNLPHKVSYVLEMARDEERVDEDDTKCVLFLSVRGFRVV